MLRTCLSIFSLSSWFAQTQHELICLGGRKTNIKCTAFCFYLSYCASAWFSLISVPSRPRYNYSCPRMIICLPWKLADCLSPVPAELLLKGVPLEKHHKNQKWLRQRTDAYGSRLNNQGQSGICMERDRKCHCLHVIIYD